MVWDVIRISEVRRLKITNYYISNIEQSAVGFLLNRTSKVHTMRVNSISPRVIELVLFLYMRYKLKIFTGIAFRHGVTDLVPKINDTAEEKHFPPITIGPIGCTTVYRQIGLSGTIGLANARRSSGEVKGLETILRFCGMCWPTGGPRVSLL